MNYINVAKFL